MEQCHGIACDNLWPQLFVDQFPDLQNGIKRGIHYPRLKVVTIKLIHTHKALSTIPAAPIGSSSSRSSGHLAAVAVTLFFIISQVGENHRQAIGQFY